MAKPKAFQIFIDTRGMVDLLSDEEAGQLFKALFAHADGDAVVPELDKIVAVAAYPMMQQIDRDREKYEDKCQKNSEAGKKSAESKRIDKQTSAHVNERQQALTNVKNFNQYKNKDEDKDKDKKKVKKEKYGVFENVLLTKEELTKLKEAYSDYLDRINRLSEYIESSGKVYKSHYATILSWARKDKTEGKPPPGKKSGVYSAAGASFDLEKYERSDLFDR